MDLIKNLFPYSFKKKANGVALLINILVQLVIGAIAGVLIGIFGGIAVIGFIVRICCGLIDLYVLVGIILSILDYAEVI